MAENMSTGDTSVCAMARSAGAEVVPVDIGKMCIRDSTKTALITIGHFLGDDYERSKLYDPTFSHEFREASK